MNLSSCWRSLSVHVEDKSPAIAQTSSIAMHHGRGLDNYTKPYIWHQSSGNTSVLQGNSSTALYYLATVHNFWLYYTGDLKNCAAHLTTIMQPPSSYWWCDAVVGCLVGVKALDSSVERLRFNLQSTPSELLSTLQRNIFQCQLVNSPLFTITSLRSRTFKTLPLPKST